jgi:hypothetical protein
MDEVIFGIVLGFEVGWPQLHRLPLVGLALLVLLLVLLL